MTVFDYINENAFFLSAILVLLSCLIYTLAQHHTDRPQNIIYIISAALLSVTALVNIIYSYEMHFAATDNTARTAVIVSNFIYFILHGAQPLLLLYYSLFATRGFQRVTGYAHAVYMAPFVIGELLVLTNPATGVVWSFDSDMRFVRGFGVYIIYAAGAFYIIMTLRQFLTRWAGITRKKQHIILFSFIVAVAGTLIQVWDLYASTELFGEAIGLMGIMLALEYDEDRLDTATGVYNRSALIKDMGIYFETGRRFYCVCVRFSNLEALKRTSGVADDEEIFRLVAGYLTSVHPRYMIYRVNRSSFVLVNMRGGEGQVRFLAQTIAWKLEEGWEYKGRHLPLSGAVLYAGVPDELKSFDDILLMCESPLPSDEKGAILMGDDLRAILYRANLETALHRGLAEHNFRVYYQPVYTADGSRMYSAESLIRLNDPEFGELFPNDFIPAAERNGMIEQLGEYTLDEVCRFLESGVPDRLGIRYINVNLSVVQCMNPDFAANVKRIVSSHSVSPSRINFEITETVAAMDYAALDEVIRELKADGYMFSMEGYGTGFSNLHSVFSLDFDIIKMDKRLLWEADRTEEGWTVLENSVRLVHGLSHEVVVVGVETRDQFERTKKLGVDWYQGNYFSKPLSRGELESMA